MGSQREHLLRSEEDSRDPGAMGVGVTARARLGEGLRFLSAGTPAAPVRRRGSPYVPELPAGMVGHVWVASWRSAFPGIHKRTATEEGSLVPSVCHGWSLVGGSLPGPLPSFSVNDPVSSLGRLRTLREK